MSAKIKEEEIRLYITRVEVWEAGRVHRVVLSSEKDGKTLQEFVGHGERVGEAFQNAWGMAISS